MNSLPGATRRANRLLLTALVTFAVVLAVVCFLWMRGVVRKDGGIADPQLRKTSMLSHPPIVPGVFALLTNLPWLT